MINFKTLRHRASHYLLLGALTCVCWFSSPLHSQEQKVQKALPWQTILQLDNDLFAGSDRDYTNGIRFAFIKEMGPDTSLNRFLEKQLYALSGAEINGGFFKWRLKKRDNLRFAYGAGLTQLMFTPDDFTASEAPEGERPYAGWLGLEFSLHAKNDKEVSSVTLSLGTTGDASMAEEAQDWVQIVGGGCTAAPSGGLDKARGGPKRHERY